MDLIDREKLKELLESEINDCESIMVRPSFWTALSFINDLPTVEAKEVVHGEWIKTFKYVAKNINTKKVEAMFNYSCPMCGYTTANQGRHFNFCPNCGCDMRGSAE